MTDSTANLKRLIERGLSLSNVSFTKVGSSYFANIYSELHSKIITSTVYTGFAENPSVALGKAISEMIERFAFSDGYTGGIPNCQTSRSDGFAALPLDFGDYQFVLNRVRQNALNEAIERYVWAKWWDSKTKAKIERIHFDQISSSINSSSLDLLSDLKSRCSFENVYKVTPYHNIENKNVVIFIVPLDAGGFISGGACDNNFDSAITRGMAELYRHGLAWERARMYALEPQTFYEQRLLFFASGRGDKLVLNVLDKSSTSENGIEIPSLKFDSIVPHKFSDFYLCYRCLFHNQPLFGDGDLERLCL